MSTAKTFQFAFTLLTVTLRAGASAVDMKNVCPKEVVKLSCPLVEQAIKSGDYKELFWKVADPRDKSKSERELGYCDENLSCVRYNSLGNFAKRITIRTDPKNGVLYVEQWIKDDLLTFTCSVQRKHHKGPLVYQLNVSSSVNCLTLIANQNFNLSGALGKMVSMGNIQDIWWYWIKSDGKMQKIAYCNSESCVFDECNSTCQSRLRIDGATLELTEVREGDRGLQLQCRIFPKFQVYTMKISVVLPKDSYSSPSITLGKNTQMPSKNSELPSKSSRKSSAGSYGAQTSASGGTLLAFTSVLIGWILAVLEIP